MKYAYDNNDNRVLEVNALGDSAKTEYNAINKVASVMDATGRTTHMQYDFENRLTRTTFEDFHSSSIVYDALGRRVRSIDANSHITSMAYDESHRMIFRTYPNGNQERYAYNANGAVLSHVKGQGSTAFEYDAMNREVYRKHFNSGHEVVSTYTYDVLNRMATVVSPQSQTTRFTTTRWLGRV